MDSKQTLKCALALFIALFFAPYGTLAELLSDSDTAAKEIWLGPAQSPEVDCALLSVPGAVAVFSRFKSARICVPKNLSASKKLPLHLFAHANLGGSVMALAYNRILEQIAARGFVVAAYLGCAIDLFCDNGETSFIEIFKTIAALKNSSAWKDAIDWNALYSMSGHSTGARSVLQVAALRDSPSYMSSTKFSKLLTPTVRAEIARVGAIVSNHPDEMYESYYNPDVRILRYLTPVMIVTGSNDHIEDTGSAWRDFTMIHS